MLGRCKRNTQGKSVAIMPIGVTQFSDIEQFCYGVSEEYAMGRFESEPPDDGGYVPSENANYIWERYIQSGIILIIIHRGWLL